MPGRFESTEHARDALDRWITALTAKREAIDAAIVAIRGLYRQLDQIGPELAASLGEAALARHGYRVPAPTLLDLWIPGHSPPTGDERGIPVPPKYTGRHRDRVFNYFLDRGNEPASNLEIRTATGLSRGAVAVVLYSEGSTFEKVRLDRRGKQTWRLAPHAFEQGIAERAARSTPADEGAG